MLILNKLADTLSLKQFILLRKSGTHPSPVSHMGQKLFCKYLANLKSFGKNKIVLKSASELLLYM